MSLSSWFSPRVTDEAFAELVRVACIEVVQSRAHEPTPWTEPSLLALVRGELQRAFGNDVYWWRWTLKAIRHVNPTTLEDVKTLIDLHVQSKCERFPEVTDSPLKGWRPDVILRLLRHAIPGYLGHYVLAASTFRDDPRPPKDTWEFKPREPRNLRDRPAVGLSAVGDRSLVIALSLTFDYTSTEERGYADAVDRATHAHQIIMQTLAGAREAVELNRTTSAVFENSDIWFRRRHYLVYPIDHINTFHLEAWHPTFRSWGE
jgi:hypothetical protein